MDEDGEVRTENRKKKNYVFFLSRHYSLEAGFHPRYEWCDVAAKNDTAKWWLEMSLFSCVTWIPWDFTVQIPKRVQPERIGVRCGQYCFGDAVLLPSHFPPWDSRIGSDSTWNRLIRCKGHQIHLHFLKEYELQMSYLRNMSCVEDPDAGSKGLWVRFPQKENTTTWFTDMGQSWVYGWFQTRWPSTLSYLLNCQVVCMFYM